MNVKDITMACTWIFARITTRRHKLEHLAINSTTAVVGKVGFSLASAVTPVVELIELN